MTKENEMMRGIGMKSAASVAVHAKRSGAGARRSGRWLAFGTTLSLLAGVVVACSSSSSGDSTAACDSYYDALIGAQTRCGGSLEVQENSKERFRKLCQTALGAPGTGVTGDVINKCASAINAEACDSGRDLDELCPTPAGQLDDGQPCDDSAQCKGKYCRTNQSDGPMAGCGVCGTRAKEGQSCTDVPCESGLDCYNETCQKEAKVGEACDQIQGPKCGNNLACDALGKKCIERKSAGEACTGLSQCKSQLSCVEGKCAERLAAGASCVDTQNRCASGLACSQATGKCEKRTYANAGEKCDREAIGCKVGSCMVGDNAAEGTCPKVIPDGQPCSENNDAETCDTYAKCIDGRCQIPDPKRCASTDAG